MKCIECEHHKFFANTHWCEAKKKHKRIAEEDVYKDVPCKYGRAERRDNELV